MSTPQNGPLTGTEERPIEQIPDAPSTLRDWTLLLGGPAIWMAHFMAVYLAAEVACGPSGPSNWAFFGEDALLIFTVVITVIAALTCAALAWVCRQRLDADEWKIDFSTGGLLLSIGSIIGVLTVGAPAVVLTPLC